MHKHHWLECDRINELALILILLAAYVYTFPRWADPNQNSRLDMAAAIVDDGTFQIDRYVANTVDYASVGGHAYSDKPPGAAFLAVPIYTGLKLALSAPLLDGLVARLADNAAFQATLRAGGSGIYEEKLRFALAQVAAAFALGVVPTLLVALLMYRLLRRMGAGREASAFAVLAYGLLTPAFAYANAFYSHQLSAALLFAAFYLAADGDRVQRPAILLAIGLLLGYAVISEYPVVLIAVILAAFTLYRLYRVGRPARIAWILPTGLALMAGWMAYNEAVFGGPLKIGYEYSADWTVQHTTGFMSLTYPHADAAWGLLFGAFRGLFMLSPLLLLAFPGFVAWWRVRTRRAEWLVAAAAILAMYLFNASSIMWWGGFAVGPRYLLPALPFLALPLAFAAQRWGRAAWFRALAGALALWSLVATWGLTLAGQAFPSDAIQNPLLEYALPSWLAGDVARNLGTIAGLRGAASLVPLAAGLALLGLAWWRAGRGLRVGVARRQAFEPEGRTPA